MVVVMTSLSCGKDHDVYFLSSTITDIISTVNIFLIKIKTIPVIFWSTKKIDGLLFVTLLLEYSDI